MPECRFQNLQGRKRHAAPIFSRTVECIEPISFEGIGGPITNKNPNDSRHTFSNMNEAEMKSLRTLKEALVQLPILALPRSELTDILHTDECDKQIGAVLMQRDGDKSLRPTGYDSRALTALKRNYDEAERKCLEIVCAVLLLLHSYLY